VAATLQPYLTNMSYLSPSQALPIVRALLPSPQQAWYVTTSCYCFLCVCEKNLKTTSFSPVLVVDLFRLVQVMTIVHCVSPCFQISGGSHPAALPDEHVILVTKSSSTHCEGSVAQSSAGLVCYYLLLLFSVCVCVKKLKNNFILASAGSGPV